MPHYKDSNNQIYWFDSEDEYSNFAPVVLMKITDLEADDIHKMAILPPSVADVRAKRDNLLASCDWTQCRDVPDLIAIAWQPYRKALRDITIQEGFPDSITWPAQP